MVNDQRTRGACIATQRQLAGAVQSSSAGAMIKHWVVKDAIGIKACDCISLGVDIPGEVNEIQPPNTLQRAERG